MKSIEFYLQAVNDLVWGLPTLVLMLGVGAYLSIKTRFLQVRLFPDAIRNFFQKLRGSGREQGVSSYQSLCTALSATVGTGNIAGVAGAIALGGPGAIFWMWVCALLGMITKFAEASLAVIYQRRTSKGIAFGGPMYMIEAGLGKSFRWLALVYAFFGVAASLGVGNATQVNSVLCGLNTALESFGIEENPCLNLLISVSLALVTGYCLLGGAGRIGAIAEKLVPIASCGYIAMGMLALILRADAIPDAFRSILYGAFSPAAVTGGVVGSFFVALRTGLSRGVFTNEAGMGTASISYASSMGIHPAEQGFMGIIEVFFDTVVICTVTALVILCCGDSVRYGIDEGAVLTSRVFGITLGNWASILLALFLACFAFATMLGWGLYGARCTEYLLGSSAWKYFVALQTVVVSTCALLKTGTIWLLAEIMNGLMAIPYLIAIAALAPVMLQAVGDYQKKSKSGSRFGGTYESFNQCKPLRAFSHEKVPSSGCGGGEEG